MRKRSHNSTIRKVAVCLRISGAASRDLLSGIMNYARDRCHWLLSIIDTSTMDPQSVLNAIKSERYDGLITLELDNPEAIASMFRSTKPLVIIGWPEPLKERPGGNIAFIRLAEREIGEFAAKELASLGQFRSFAYLRLSPATPWSILRERGFRNYLGSAGIIVKSCSTPFFPADQNSDAKLVEWLRKLPKPAALFTAFDELAVKAINLCRENNIDIPNKISVLGVDNDTLLCDFTTPPLSSIQPDHIKAGAMAAQTLDRIFRHKHSKAQELVCRGFTIARRESTKTVTPASHLVNAAQRFIQRNATRDICVMDVVRHLHVSRRLADLRFREITGTTMLQAIHAARLGHVAMLLRSSSRRIQDIAAACDFANLQQLANVFRRQYGCSMTQYRKLSSPRQKSPTQLPQ